MAKITFFFILLSTTIIALSLSSPVDTNLEQKSVEFNPDGPLDSSAAVSPKKTIVKRGLYGGLYGGGYYGGLGTFGGYGLGYYPSYSYSYFPYYSRSYGGYGYGSYYGRGYGYYPYSSYFW